MLWILAYVFLFWWARSEEVTNVLEKTENINSSVLRSVKNTWMLAGECLVFRNWKRPTCPCSFCSKTHLCRTMKIPKFCTWTFWKDRYYIFCIKCFPDSYTSETTWLLQSYSAQNVGEEQKTHLSLERGTIHFSWTKTSLPNAFRRV